MKVWEEAFAAWDDTPADPNAMHSGDQAAAAVIAADRAGLVARIAELKSEVEVLADNGCHLDALCKQQEAEIERLWEVAITLHGALAAHTCYGCPACHGDCSSANPPMMFCPTAQARAAYFMFDRAALKDTRHDADA
jgi:hypothetical protein